MLTDSLTPVLLDAPSAASAPLYLLREGEYDAWLSEQPEATRRWAEAQGFRAKAGSVLRIPDAQGALVGVAAGIGADADRWALAGLPAALGEGAFHIAQAERYGASVLHGWCLGWQLGAYRFARYLTQSAAAPRYAQLAAPSGVDAAQVQAEAEAVAWARDLINTPAGDLPPAALADAAEQLAARHNAACRVIHGDALLEANYPCIHAVGRASDDPPCLVDLTWGDASAPKVTLVGKGITFDSGGLDIKPESAMQLMKKDMGGAALALGLAHAVMARELPIRLRVLIPAAENAISGNAFRPLDILTTRKGLSVEVGNTDAEGRLVLCDALAEADSETPALLIDCATLTGAARVALGTEIPAFFTRDDVLAKALERTAAETQDMLWRLPLWQAYARHLESPVADLNSAPGHRYAGAITAALFLARFVSPSTPWLHVDTMAWNLDTRPGRPKGGEAFALRALLALLETRFATHTDTAGT